MAHDMPSFTLLSQNLFHTNCRIIWPSPVKNATGILIQIALNLKTVLGSRIILIILIIPIHEHSISFHLFVLSSVSLISVL